MVIPSFQKWSSSRPPQRAIHINVSDAIAGMAPNVDWAFVFARVYSYFQPFDIAVTSFPYQTSPVLVCEVEVLWANPFGKGAPKARGATDRNAFILQQAGGDFCRYKSLVWIRETTGEGKIPGLVSDPRIADDIAHEAVHHFCGGAHVSPRDGKPVDPRCDWLMAEDPDENKTKMLDNGSIKILLKTPGPKR